MSSTKLAGLLSCSVDAAGAKLRRLEKKGQVRKNLSDLYERVGGTAAAVGEAEAAAPKKKLVDMSDDELEEELDKSSAAFDRHKEAQANGTSTATLAKRGVAHRNPAATKPLFGGKPK